MLIAISIAPWLLGEYRIKKQLLLHDDYTGFS